MAESGCGVDGSKDLAPRRFDVTLESFDIGLELRIRDFLTMKRRRCRVALGERA